MATNCNVEQSRLPPLPSKGRILVGPARQAWALTPGGPIAQNGDNPERQRNSVAKLHVLRDTRSFHGQVEAALKHGVMCLQSVGDYEDPRTVSVSSADSGPKLRSTPTYQTSQLESTQ